MARTDYLSLPDMKKARSRVKKSEILQASREVPALVAEYGEGRKYFIKTFGCQGNVRDEEVLGGFLELAGMTKAVKEEEADVVLINTCAVRENAEEKVYGEIGKFKAKHYADPEHFILGVCGCMMQQEGVAEKIMHSYPYVNLIFGTHNIPEILNLIDAHLKRKKDLVSIVSGEGNVFENLPSTRLDNIKAFVNISYGCDKFCTYCIVPYTRGRERSRPLKDIVEECRGLVEEGFQEITLLGENVNSYGKDFHDGTNFATCLRQVAETGIPRLRFMTSHPWDFSSDMLEVIASHPNIMKCIHLPLQSGNDEILAQMGRRYTRQKYLDLVKEIREKIPGCAITTDIIVGFPNENEEQFNDTLTLCEEVKYDAAFTFLYSPRKGTPAAAMKDNVPDSVKHERFNRLLKVIEAGVMSHSKEMVGKTYSVLVDGPSKKDPKMLSGYTESGKLINFAGPAALKGAIVSVKVIEDRAFSMIGELTEDPLILLAKRLGETLRKEEQVEAFFSARKSFLEDPTLKELRAKMEDAQKRMMSSAAAQNDEDYVKAKKDFESFKKLYEEHPVTKNYLSAQEDVLPLLKEIGAVLQ
ncbi:MAG: tRNA (N6-isopentenyl adenosine(37)-C2)-methylthiotransferase MiaB [Candidatus Enteromonas sp.]|nr:tRNA (N6-isopentenyl adenosine(37)-C2)-methylthiotransferase MiaB [bacterium]MDD6917524.1 tRNA (N6-isopentenyl adenosine(37)-C2)-methylthiotransferase MiaB [bacterium]MDY6100499.1 tRNA (N6-isopentenyl adenosine(37)-C2)-methylthiotransferase MiaB [Candidatus Enteromonas sp.]